MYSTDEHSYVKSTFRPIGLSILAFILKQHVPTYFH